MLATWAYVGVATCGCAIEFDGSWWPALFRAVELDDVGVCRLSFSVVREYEVIIIV